ncbi:MAG: COX15/CtaA family protein [Betaproteobacteria bacterium]|nr:COX15/CtaA family protein [Betaproteobacteria bacterium]
MERSVILLITLTIIVSVARWVRLDSHRYYQLIKATTALTLILVVLGAFVRLSDAGLGCPDWPGCYGNLTPAHSAAAIEQAQAIQPHGPVTLEKAWKEMVHRYLAMFVGSLIAAILVCAIIRRGQQSLMLPVLLVASVVFQAALGAWTVTMLLRPAIVTSHLLGGITLLCLLVLLLAKQPQSAAWTRPIKQSGVIRLFAGISLLAVVLQIALGGWVSTNYAALACTDFPTCNGKWIPQMDFANAFHLIRPLGVGPDGELLTLSALQAIHWVHRLGAALVFIIVGSFGLRLRRAPDAATASTLLLVILVVQLGLGISNVWFSLPLGVAVAHNGMAAILVAWLVIINIRLHKMPVNHLS